MGRIYPTHLAFCLQDDERSCAITNSGDHYECDDEIEAVVRGFETCTTLDSKFDHPAHLTVALSYLHCSNMTVPQAAEHMRASLYRFLDHYKVGRQKYNETITLFWIKLVRAFLNRTDRARPVWQIGNEMIGCYSRSQLIYDYYTKDHLLSEEARNAWVGPDVKPLDF